MKDVKKSEDKKIREEQKKVRELFSGQEVSPYIADLMGLSLSLPVK